MKRITMKKITIIAILLFVLSFGTCLTGCDPKEPDTTEPASANLTFTAPTQGYDYWTDDSWQDASRWEEVNWSGKTLSYQFTGIELSENGKGKRFPNASMINCYADGAVRIYTLGNCTNHLTYLGYWRVDDAKTTLSVVIFFTQNLDAQTSEEQNKRITSFSSAVDFVVDSADPTKTVEVAMPLQTVYNRSGQGKCTFKAQDGSVKYTTDEAWLTYALPICEEWVAGEAA